MAQKHTALEGWVRKASARTSSACKFSKTAWHIDKNSKGCEEILSERWSAAQKVQISQRLMGFKKPFWRKPVGDPRVPPFVYGQRETWTLLSVNAVGDGDSYQKRWIIRRRPVEPSTSESPFIFWLQAPTAGLPSLLRFWRILGQQWSSDSFRSGLKPASAGVKVYGGLAGQEELPGAPSDLFLTSSVWMWRDLLL